MPCFSCSSLLWGTFLVLIFWWCDVLAITEKRHFLCVGSSVLTSQLVPDLRFVCFNLQSPFLFYCFSVFFSFHHPCLPFQMSLYPWPWGWILHRLLHCAPHFGFWISCFSSSVGCLLQALVASSSCSICSVVTELLPELASNVSGTSINPWQDNALYCLEERVRIKHHLSGTGHLLNNCNSTQCSLLWTRVKGTFISYKTEPF